MAKQDTLVERVTIKNREYRAVREGLAQILAPYRDVSDTAKKSGQPKPSKQQNTQPRNNDEGDQAVFYNPIQQYNRDLSVLAILTYGEGVVVEKKARWDKKFRKGGGASAKAKKQGAAVKGKESEDAEVNGKKRKADDLVEVGAEGAALNKKARVDDEDENDDLEVRKLGDLDPEADHEKSTAIPQQPVEQASERVEKPTPFTILDALSASGLRAIRYAKEIPFTTNIIANDLSPEAVKSIELNIDHNEVRGRVHSNVGDARAYMYSKVGNENQSASDKYVHRFDVIDLDPYGTAAPFLDSAVQALVDGGLLCVTCTDAGVFASNGYPEKAYALYGGATVKGFHSHEAGLRLILHAVASSAAKYGIAIEPLLSLSIDFYARLFIRVHKRAQDVKLLAGTTMLTYSCDSGCGAWKTQLVARNQSKSDRNGHEFFKHSYAQAPTTSQLCSHCGYKMHLGGPMWAGPIHNPHFVQRILNKLPDVDTTTYATTDRIRGMLTVALEEDLADPTSVSALTEEQKSNRDVTGPDARIIPRLPAHLVDKTPFFFAPNALARVIHAISPSESAMRGAIRSLGYLVTRSHCKPGSFKTNAPWEVLWEIMREWVRQKHPIRDGALNEGSAGSRIMNKARESESRLVEDILGEIKNGVGTGGGKEQLKTCLEAALYRLQHGVSNGAVASTALDHATSGSNEPSMAPAVTSQPLDVSKLQVVFDSKLGEEQRRGRLVRYQVNPRANWGPMSRAGGGQ